MAIERLVHIGNTVRNAVIFGSGSWDASVVNADGLPAAVQRLFTMLHDRGVPYVLVGGVAMLRYVPGRNTEDLDLIMAAASLKRVPEIRVHSQDKDFARGSFDGLQIDILLTSNRLFHRVQQRYATRQHFQDVDVMCATVQGLLLLKLYALTSLYCQGDLIRAATYELDILSLLHLYNPALEPILAELAPHVSATDLDAVRDVLTDIRRRMERGR
jgi:hypothetical protein